MNILTAHVPNSYVLSEVKTFNFVKGVFGSLFRPCIVFLRIGKLPVN